MRMGLYLSLVLLLSGPFSAAATEKNEDVCKAADRALAAGNFEVARSQYQTCLRQALPRFETLSNLGVVYAHFGQFDEAIATYQQAVALRSENPNVRTNLGLALLKTGRYDEAAREFARALLVDPGNAQVQELLAFCQYQLKQYELAALQAERARKARPNEASAAFLLGSAYSKMGLYDKAIPLIAFALRQAGTAETHAIMGETYLGVRAYRRALDEFTKAVEMQPQMPGLHSHMGVAYAGLGNTGQAIAEFEKALEKDSEDFDSNYYLGHLRRLGGDAEGAKKFLAKADQLRPGDPSVLYEYAVFALQAKDYAKAESLLRQVLDKYPNYTEAHVLLSQVYFRTRRREGGEREKAIAEALQKDEQARRSSHGSKDGQAYGDDSSLDAVQP